MWVAAWGIKRRVRSISIPESERQTEVMRKRLVEVDMARAIATIAVVMIHVTATPLIVNPKGGGLSITYLILNITARFAVPIFVVISGLGLTLSDRKSEGYFHFIYRRLMKIIPAYVVWTVIYTLIYDDNTGALAFNHRPALSVYLNNLRTGNACYHLYFIPMIVLLYLVYPLLRDFLQTRTGLICAAVITTTSMCISKYMDYPSWADYPLDYISPLNWLFFLALGVWFAKPEVREKFKSSSLRWISPTGFVLTAVVMIAIVRHRILMNVDIDTAIESLGPLIIVYTVFFMIWMFRIDWKEGWIVKTLSWISRHSYTIYLSHAIVLAAIFKSCYKIDAHSYGAEYEVITFILVFSGAALLSLLGSKLSYAAKRIITQT